MRRDSVRGLTTAASVWVTAAVGTTAGAGLLVLAALTLGIYFLVTLGFPVARRLLPLAPNGTAAVRVRYPDGHGISRRVLSEACLGGRLAACLGGRLPWCQALVAACLGARPLACRYCRKTHV